MTKNRNVKWKREYFQPILDGTQWNLTRLVQKKQKNKYDSNDFPKVYEELMRMLEAIEMGYFYDI